MESSCVAREAGAVGHRRERPLADHVRMEWQGRIARRSRVISLRTGNMTREREYAVRGKPKMRPPHPGAMLREDVLPALNTSVAGAARELGISRQLLHNILAERAPVS